MKLETAERISSAQATEVDIGHAFADDHGRGEYIILSRAEQIFIQASGEGEGPYAVEYRDGGKDRHFQCTRDLSKAEVETVFLKYLRGDSGWLTDLEWRPLETKPWWKFW
jgi:hypothetical protein